MDKDTQIRENTNFNHLCSRFYQAVAEAAKDLRHRYTQAELEELVDYIDKHPQTLAPKLTKQIFQEFVL